MSKRRILLAVIFLTVSCAGWSAEVTEQGSDDKSFLFKLPDVLVTGENESYVPPPQKKENFSESLLEFDLNQMSKDLPIPNPGGMSPYEALGENVPSKDLFFKAEAAYGILPEGGWSILLGKEFEKLNGLLSLQQIFNQGTFTHDTKDGFNQIDGLASLHYDLGNRQSLNLGVQYLGGQVDLPYGIPLASVQDRSMLSFMTGYDGDLGSGSLNVVAHGSGAHRNAGRDSDNHLDLGVAELYSQPLDAPSFDPIQISQKLTLRRQNLDSDGISNNPFYINLQVGMVSPRLSSFLIEASLRWADYHDAATDENELFFNGKLTYYFYSDTYVFLAYEPALEMPEFEDLYLRQLYSRVNPLLSAQDIPENWVIGGSLPITGQGALGASWFSRWYKSYRLFGGPDGQMLWLPENASDVREQGVEISLDYVLSKTISFVLGYKLDEVSVIAPNVAENSASALVKYSESDWAVGTESQWAGNRYYDGLGNSLSPYFLLDAWIERRNILPGLSLWVKAKNILGQSYEVWQGYSQPGAAVTEGLSWVF